MINSKIGNQYFHGGQHPFNAAKNNSDFKQVKKDPVEVIARIIRNQASLYNKEIANWKMARYEAEDTMNPRRVLLTELYNDIALDAFIKGIMWNKRILKISNKPFKVVDSAGKDKEDLGKMLQKSWMNKAIKLSMESRFYGHSLIYFWEIVNGEFTEARLVPRKHVIPECNVWVSQEYDMPESGYDFTKPPFSNFMVGVGEHEDLGILNSAAPLYILKKHSWANWDEFEEIFGVPIRIAKLATNDPKVRAEVQSWLSSMGTAAYGIFPEDANLDIKESKQTDAFDVFNQKRIAANQELEILMLGTKSASEMTGTYGKEKVNQEEQNEVVEDDKTFIGNLINDKFIPLLRTNGYPFADGDQFEWDDAEWEDPKDKLAIFEGVKRLGYTLDQDQVQNDLGVTITGETPPEPDPNKTDPKKNVPGKKKAKTENSMVELNKCYFGHDV
jgi:hypothetical protein